MSTPDFSNRLWLVVLLIALALTTFPLWAQSGITEHAVQFPRGKSGTTIQGSLRGDETIDYKLRAAAGQEMKVRLKPGTVYFNVLPPGSRDVALFVGSRDGDAFAGKLPEAGEYRIRVYQMGNAASSGKLKNFTIEVSVTGAAAGADVATASSDHIERAGQGRFDATGKIPCAWATGQPMNQCDFGVARAGGGTATVVVSRPDGRKRTIFFEKGKAIGADLSQADGDMTFRVTKEADLFKIQAGRERYEMPEAVVLGG
ncbi:MAG: hypothetical protein HXY24_05625 [Rubrivivax sp.]|nr:hypothetical protein [Rubrivivax sp.]